MMTCQYSFNICVTLHLDLSSGHNLFFTLQDTYTVLDLSNI